MNPQAITLSYKTHPIHLELNGDVMINATEMAAIFGKRPNDYLSLPSTKQLLERLCDTEKSGINPLQNPLEKWVVTRKSGNRKGTWMHRWIAIDFAQWLSVDFKIWVIKTIDDLLFNRYKSRSDYFEKKTAYYEELKFIELQIQAAQKTLRETEAYKKVQELKGQMDEIKTKMGTLERGFFGKQLVIELDSQ